MESEEQEMKTPLDPYDPIDPKPQRDIFTRLKEAYPGWVQTPRDKPIIPKHPPLRERPQYTYMPYREPYPSTELIEVKPKPMTREEIDRIYFGGGN
jgi:hypothetical protein